MVSTAAARKICMGLVSRHASNVSASAGISWGKSQSGFFELKSAGQGEMASEAGKSRQGE